MFSPPDSLAVNTFRCAAVFVAPLGWTILMSPSRSMKKTRPSGATSIAIGLPVSVCSRTFWNIESGGSAAAGLPCTAADATGSSAATRSPATTNAHLRKEDRDIRKAARTDMGRVRDSVVTGTPRVEGRERADARGVPSVLRALVTGEQPADNTKVGLFGSVVNR